MLGIFIVIGEHGYSLQIKNVNDKNEDGDGQVLLSLMALTYYHREMEPMIGAIVHPLRVSLFCVPEFYNSLFSERLDWVWSLSVALN